MTVVFFAGIDKIEELLWRVKAYLKKRQIFGPLLIYPRVFMRRFRYFQHTSNFQKIKVPSNLNASLISEKSFCIYQRDFTLPGTWTGRDVYINFDGIDTFFYIYINDEFAGAGNSTNRTAEFRITPLLKAGKNTVTVITLAKSGISRDVYLLARTPDHIRDFKVRTTLDTIYIDIEATKENGAATVELYDNNNQLIVRKDSIIKNSQASFEIKIDNPINWTAENPYLYTALIHGFNEVIPVRVGLRIYTVNEAGEFVTYTAIIAE